jgi:hypothetical protein
LSLPTWVKNVTGIIWLPTLVVAYFYIGKRGFSMTEGLMSAFLVFSVSRPFLPEQWAIYPLAFLLLSRSDMGNFIGLATTGFSGLLANNTLLVNFFSPVSAAAFNWEFLSPFPYYRAIIIFLLAGFFLLESTLALAGRPSLIFRALSSVSFKTREFLSSKYGSIDEHDGIIR